MSSFISSVLSQNAFWVINKKLVAVLEGNYSAAVLLADLIQRRDYFDSRGDLTKDGSFYVLSEAIEKDLLMGAQMRRRSSKDLQDAGFITVTAKQTTVPSKGIQTVNYYTINDNAILYALRGTNAPVPSHEPIDEGRGLQNTRAGVTKHEGGGYKTATQIRIEDKREEREKFSQDDVYRKWLSEVPERADFKECYEELLVLLESLKVSGYSSSELSSSFRKKVLARWERSKYPDRHATLWDKAVGAIFGGGLTLAVPEVKEGSGVKIKRSDGSITIETALAMMTDDDEIERMMREYEEIRSRPNRGDDHE